ncbi:hypothetical protein Tco_1361175 [Tanacetum coccineum]
MLVWREADSETSQKRSLRRKLFKTRSKLEYKFQDEKNSKDIFSIGSALEDVIFVVFVLVRNIIGSWEQSDIKGAFKKDVIPFSEIIKETFKFFEKGFIAEVKEMKDIFEQMEDEVDQCSVANKCFKIEKKQLLIKNDRLLEENISCDIICTYLRSLNEVDNCGKYKSLEIVLLDLQESNKSLCELRKSFANLEEYSITLDLAFQHYKEQMINNDSQTKNK